MITRVTDIRKSKEHLKGIMPDIGIDGKISVTGKHYKRITQ